MDLSPVWVTRWHRMMIIVLLAICYLHSRSADDLLHADFVCPRAVLRSVSRWVARGKRVSAAKMSTFVNMRRGNPKKTRDFKFTRVNFVNHFATRTVHKPAVWLTGKAKKLTESYLVDRFLRKKLTPKPCCQPVRPPVAPASPDDPAPADAPARSPPQPPRPSCSCRGSSRHPLSPPSPRSDPRLAIPL